MKNRKVRLLGALFAAALPAIAAPTAVVEAVQYPAWIERGGQAAPLKPGMELQARDALRTGGDGRVRMRLSEGSTVKLGEKAAFSIEKAEPAGIFRASLQVAAGAFRFTTDEARKGEKRDIEIRALNVTAGVRGTDLWGKATPERSFVVLIEGRIEVSSQGHPAVSLATPLDFYERRGDAGPSVQRMDVRTLNEYARETEMRRDGAVATASGRWRVVAAALADRGAAAELNATLRASGYPSEIEEGERGLLEVHVPGLEGEAQARALATTLRGVKGVSMPTIRALR